LEKLHNGDLHNLYSSPSINDHVKEDEIDRACSMNGRDEECTWDIVGKPKGKRPLGRRRHWRVDNIKMDLREIG
jgi:hypothetical protein